MQTEYEISNVGSNAFPQYEVRLCFIDENGFEFEHLSKFVGSSPSLAEARKIEARHRGCAAGLAGKSEDSNPYASGGERWEWWSIGWYEGFSERQAPEVL